MTNNLYIEGEINPERVQEFMGRLMLSDPEQELTIYITSSGGDLYAVEVLKDYIESNFGNVHIVVAGYVISAMWRFLLTLKNRASVRIIGRAYAQDHNSTVYTDISYSKTSNYRTKVEVIRDVAEEDMKYWYNLCKDEFGYTKEELKCFDEGKEIYINHERMKEIIRNSEFYLKKR